MFVNEVGVGDNKNLICFFGLVAELDFDWGIMDSERN